MHLPTPSLPRRLRLAAVATLWVGMNSAAVEPRPADLGASLAKLALEARLNEMGLVLNASMANSPTPTFLCAEKQRTQLALDPKSPSTLVWTRCVPANCQDARSLPSECWLRGSDGGTLNIGYARDHVEIAGPARIEFAGQGDADTLPPELISLEDVPLGGGREGLLISTKLPGSNHTLLQCLMSYSGSTYQCLASPGLDEEVKGLTPAATKNLEEFGMSPTSDGLLMRYGVFLPGDPNCCPCAVIEARLEPGPNQIRVSAVKVLPSQDDEGCAAKLKRAGAGPRDSALAALRQAKVALDFARSRHDQADAWFDLQVAAVAFARTNGVLTFDSSPSTPAAQRAASASALGIEIARCGPAGIWAAHTTGYEHYLKLWPDGPRADEAAWQSRIPGWCGDFEASAEEWEALLSRLSAFLADFPRGRHAAEAAQLVLEARRGLAEARAATDGGSR